MARRVVDYQDIVDQFREGRVFLHGVMVDGDNDILHELGEDDIINTEISIRDSDIYNLNLNGHPPPDPRSRIFRST
jgi:hypothetical protein